jgi:hypothetical protein
MVASSLGLVIVTIACSQVLQAVATPTKEPKQFKGKALAEVLNKDITAKP